MPMPEKGGHDPMNEMNPEIIRGGGIVVGSTMFDLKCGRCPAALNTTPDARETSATIECAVLNALLAGERNEAAERVAAVSARFRRDAFGCPPVRIFENFTDPEDLAGGRQTR
jgi:hypothetical protein